MPYANNKGADQPAHPRSLISTFVIRCLDSLIPLVVSKSEISSLWLVSVTEQAGLSLTWLQTPKTGFLVTWLKYEYCSSYGLRIIKFEARWMLTHGWKIGIFIVHAMLKQAWEKSPTQTVDQIRRVFEDNLGITFHISP